MQQAVYWRGRENERCWAHSSSCRRTEEGWADCYALHTHDCGQPPGTNALDLCDRHYFEITGRRNGRS